MMPIVTHRQIRISFLTSPDRNEGQASSGLLCPLLTLHVRQEATVRMQRLSYPTETVLSNKNTRNRIVLSFKNSPWKALGYPASCPSISWLKEEKDPKIHYTKISSRTASPAARWDRPPWASWSWSRWKCWPAPGRASREAPFDPEILTNLTESNKIF